MKVAKAKIFLIVGVSQILISCAPNKLEETSPLEIENKNSDYFGVSKGKDLKDKDLETHAAKSNPDFNFDTQGKNSFWEDLTSNFRIDREVGRDEVQTHINWYKRNPRHVERVAQRAKPYLQYIVKELKKNSLPLELALLPFIESAFDPFAYSHGRASGLWQFIPSTGRLYGLKIDWWYDGRRDVRESTRAAIRYLKRLNKLFEGDWLLAIAAYNAGEGNILKSIRRSGVQREQVTFWHLKVLSETSSYIPRLLAISEVISYPGKYGITLPDIPDEPYWGVVDIARQIDLNKAARLAEISQEDIVCLLIRALTSGRPTQTAHTNYFCRRKKSKFLKRISESWKRMSISIGDVIE